MNKDKIYIEGYEVGFSVDTTGAREKKIQVASGEIVSIDERFIYKSIEPEKVKVPQCVADWYEKKKHDLNHYIWDYIYNWNHQEESEFKRWMNCSIISFQTLVNMHQFGYEVEKEKRYFVKIRATKHYIAKDGTGKIFFL
ncbi:hypothetical protein Javan336_0029 [Streptococcus phage Javan336]|uniref:DUF1642 domain-containing protein n=1 Tax=Streptococcus mitis TaxID=28037 RepID=A0A081R155_STRMT|nr:DUF1642 domain-containing protein [Streptococcus mitis]KEQ48928.1 hypothetical protein SK608_0225 [Streptococcus mitis]QBX26619.1 hypothetical protein Javan336_0029 [Streptococcus phage Javan336]